MRTYCVFAWPCKRQLLEGVMFWATFTCFNGRCLNNAQVTGLEG